MDRFLFRVWNKTTKNFTTGGAIKFGSLCFVDEEDLGIKLAEDQDNYIIEQCTGLKDKNGNLIYEGDIVRNGAYEGVVKYGKFNCSCCDGVYGWYFDDCADIRYVEYYEVVGNIHKQKDNK